MNTIEEILEIELRMFLSVNVVEEPGCREDTGMFRIHRHSQFVPWSEDTRQSYLNDLREADAAGRNLMTYKYARMDELIPSENGSPLIEKIISAQVEWQKQMFAKYPSLMKNARGVDSNEDSPLAVSFKRYSSAELETYSAETLGLLYRDVQNYISGGINMSEKVYEALVQSLGYDSLERFRAV